MNSHRLACFLLVFFLGATLASAAVMPRPAGAEAAEQSATSRQTRQEERRLDRIERFRNRLEHKLEKRMERKKTKAPASAWDDSRLRLGVILILGALALALLEALLNVGFFGFLAALVGLAGVVLVIWALVEYYG